MIISKKPPYTGTTADPARTRAAIDKLLQDYGISKYAWTQDFEHQQVQLIFEVETEIGGQKKRLNIKVAPPTFAKKHLNYNAMTGRHDKVLAPNWAQSYRLLYYWLKAKLEAVAWGLTEVEQEFLAEVVVNLPNGGVTTFGELITDPERFAKLALEQKKPEEPKPDLFAGAQDAEVQPV